MFDDLQGATFLLYLHQIQRPSYKGTNPIHEVSTFLTKLPPKFPTSKYHHIGGYQDFNIQTLGGHKPLVHSTWGEA